MSTGFPTTTFPAPMSLDSVESSEEHGRLIRGKPFLRRIYKENYQFFLEQCRDLPSGKRVELGSGGGFIKEILPDTLCSDVVPLTDCDLVFSALQLPFDDASLAAVMMVNVFHHLQDVECFFDEVVRTVQPGGKVLMIEPANTIFSRFIYSNFHHEPFEPEQQEWKLPEGGRMSVANDALPWIVFQRDREVFSRRYPELELEQYRNIMPLRYILSGGVSKRQLVPSWTYDAITGLEALLSPLNNLIGMFSQIVIGRR